MSNTEVELLADFGDQCGECPVWDPSDGVIYWTDLMGHRFYRYDRGKNAARVVREHLQITGFRRDQSGGFVIANKSGVWLWNVSDDPVLIAKEVNGFACRMNDCGCDSRGRFLAGSNFYHPGERYELGKLFSFDNRGVGTILDEGFHLANGLAFSPHYDQLYFADSVGRVIYAYDYDLAHGSVKNRRVLVRVPSNEGIPDGLTVDAEGFLWSAQWYGSCVVRYDPDGVVERRIMLPAKQTSAVAFGGPDLDELYVTSAAVSEVIPVAPERYDGNNGYFGGGLFRVRPGVQGLVPVMADLSAGWRMPDGMR